MNLASRRAQHSLLLAGTVVLLFSAGCRRAALSAPGAQVATSQSAPSEQGFPIGSCRSLGYIVGRGGGSFGGEFLTNEGLVEYAMNDLRNRAAKLGANYVQHDTPQLGVPGGDGATSTATVSGSAYYCDPLARRMGVPVAAAEPPKRSEPTVTAPPQGAGGFRFGQTRNEAGQICEASHASFRNDGDAAECSSAPSALGYPARAVLHFCADSLCGVDLVLAPEPGELSSAYDKLYASLVGKYGIPFTVRPPLPADCARDLPACLKAGQNPGGPAWNWPDSFRISLRPAQTAQGSVLALSYADPRRTQLVEPGPAL